MGVTHFCFFIATLAIIECASVRSYDVDSVLKRVPENERKSFLKHHLILGYELSRSKIDKDKILNDSQELVIPFSVKLYEKYRKDHLVNSKGGVVPTENIICFPNGECIDIDDPGVHPRIMPTENIICFPNGECIDIDDPGVHPLKQDKLQKL